MNCYQMHDQLHYSHVQATWVHGMPLEKSTKFAQSWLESFQVGAESGYDEGFIVKDLVMVRNWGRHGEACQPSKTALAWFSTCNQGLLRMQIGIEFGIRVEIN